MCVSVRVHVCVSVRVHVCVSVRVHVCAISAHSKDGGAARR